MISRWFTGVRSQVVDCRVGETSSSTHHLHARYSQPPSAGSACATGASQVSACVLKHSCSAPDRSLRAIPPRQQVACVMDATLSGLHRKGAACRQRLIRASMCLSARSNKVYSRRYRQAHVRYRSTCATWNSQSHLYRKLATRAGCEPDMCRIAVRTTPLHALAPLCQRRHITCGRQEAPFKVKMHPWV